MRLRMRVSEIPRAAIHIIWHPVHNDYGSLEEETDRND